MRARSGRVALHCCSSIAFSCAPLSVSVTRLLPNGWVEYASEYVTVPPAPLATRFVRTPPGLVNATWAPFTRVAANCASAIRRPRT